MTAHAHAHSACVRDATENLWNGADVKICNHRGKAVESNRCQTYGTKRVYSKLHNFGRRTTKNLRLKFIVGHAARFGFRFRQQSNSVRWLVSALSSFGFGCPICFCFCFFLFIYSMACLCGAKRANEHSRDAHCLRLTASHRHIITSFIMQLALYFRITHFVCLGCAFCLFCLHPALAAAHSIFDLFSFSCVFFSLSLFNSRAVTRT